MKQYNKHYPTIEEVQPLKDAKTSPVNLLVKNKMLRAEIVENPERIGEGFNVKFHFNLNDCDNFLRNTVHEVTEKKSTLRKFSHDREGTRLMNFTIETWLPSFINPENDQVLSFDELMEEPKLKSKAMTETFKNVFANDLHNTLLEKVAIAKMANDHGIKPREAAVLYENQNNNASTVTNKRNDAEFSEGLTSRLSSFLKGLSKERKSSGLAIN